MTEVSGVRNKDRDAIHHMQSRRWVVDTRCWMLGARYWILDIRSFAVEGGRYML